ncbi:MAG: hypothetical protein ACKOT0_02105 [bacterium]
MASRGRAQVRVVVVAIAVMLGLGLVPAAQSVVVLPPAPAPRCAWSVVYPLDANYAWPDTNAAYINQAVLLGAGEKVVITGRDPKARHWSITTYNFEDREVIDRVNDATVKRQGKGSKATWTVTVSPKDNPRDPNSLKSAAAYTYGDPVDRKKVTVIMYRVYLSETKGYAGGPLPVITLHHDDGLTKGTERLAPCTTDQVTTPDMPLDLVPAEGVPAQFVRAEGGRFYPSYDTSYLAAQVPYDPSRILVVTGRAPRVPRDVRYWSLCQNVNAGDLPVVDCASDKDIRLRKGRYTIAVVGPGQVPDRALYPGVTFVEWTEPTEAPSPVPDAFLIWRNILPAKSFAYAVDKVPLGQPASPTMGEYAPVISHLTLEELGGLAGS